MSIFSCPRHGLHHGPACPGDELGPCAERQAHQSHVTFEPIEQVIEREAKSRIIDTHLGSDLLGPLAGEY